MIARCNALCPCIYAEEPKGLKNISSRRNNLDTVKMKPGLSAAPIEASGICFVSDIKKYILVSDETDRKLPILFLMDNDGRVNTKMVVENLPVINDMEGIAQDGNGFYYLLSSQSFNKKGKQSAPRKQLAKIQRKGDGYFCKKSIPLWDILTLSAQQCSSQEWSAFVVKSQQEQSVDIEGITIINDTLLLGFKNPKIDNNAVIMYIAFIDTLFETEKLPGDHIGIWRKFPLFDSTTKVFCGVSDLLMVKGHLIGLSTGVREQYGLKEDTGLMWDYIPETGKMTILRNFPGIKPEGISYNGFTNEFFIVFDNGSKNPSYYLKAQAHL